VAPETSILLSRNVISGRQMFTFFCILFTVYFGALERKIFKNSSLASQTNRKSSLHSYYINKHNSKLPLLPDMKSDYMFQLKLSIIRSIPDIFLVQNTMNIMHLK
jgi:hypothetical protein